MGAAVVVNGKITIFGGETSETGNQSFTGKRTYKFVDQQQEDGKWVVKADMKVPRHGMWPVVVDEKVYVFGGGENSGYA